MKSKLTVTLEVNDEFKSVLAMSRENHARNIAALLVHTINAGRALDQPGLHVEADLVSVQADLAGCKDPVEYLAGVVREAV